MILFDTNILVEILRKKRIFLEKLSSFESVPLYISVITIMELYFGITGSNYYKNKEELKSKRLDEIIALTSNFFVLEFERKCALKTAEIMGKLKREGKIIDFRDGMIAGTALSNGIKSIFTMNIDHFDRIPEINVLSIEESI